MRILLAILFIYASAMTDAYISVKQSEQKVIEFTNYVNIPNAIEKCDKHEVVSYKYIKFKNSYKAK